MIYEDRKRGKGVIKKGMTGTRITRGRVDGEKMEQ